jgi:hypothetical protein
MKLCPSNTVRSAALSVDQGSSLRVGNDPESGADESRRPECLPWWCLCRDIAQPCRGNPESPDEIAAYERTLELHCGSLSVGAQTCEMLDSL